MVTAKETYEKLQSIRQSYESRAEDCSKYTIPSLFSKNSDSSFTTYKTPWQAVGARAVNTLAAKLMLALFPTQTWMKLSISEYEAKKLLGDEKGLVEIDKGLSMVERVLMNYIESNSYRVTLFEALKQLIITGNCLLYLPDPRNRLPYNPMKLYKLSSFVIQRDSYGNLLQIIIKDQVAVQALPKDVYKTLSTEMKKDPDQIIDIYTKVHLTENGYSRFEEIDSKVVVGSEGTYPLDACPYIPVRMIHVDGESYGRSYCEEYLGDLKSLEHLQEAIIRMAMVAAKVVILVNPNGLVTPSKITKAQSGDFVHGRKEDIQFLQVEKSVDFTVAKSVSDQITTRLSYAFMLNSSVQRSGDRVTAEEIRYVAAELEDTLGGVYSILSQELQLPIVKVLLKQLQATSQIPNLPKEAVNPTISTGLEAIGRGQDLDKLTRCIHAWAQLAPLANDSDLNLTTIKLRIANAIGIDTSGILLTEEQKLQKINQQAAKIGIQNSAAALGQGIAAQATSSPEAMLNAANTVGIPTE